MLLLALAWRRTRRLAFASAGKLIEAAKADIEAKRAAGEIDSYEFGRLNNAVRHRQIMLDAARDDMIAVEPAAEELMKELGDEHARSEERRVGKECVRKCRSRWSKYH